MRVRNIRVAGALVLVAWAALIALQPAWNTRLASAGYDAYQAAAAAHAREPAGDGGRHRREKSRGAGPMAVAEDIAGASDRPHRTASSRPSSASTCSCPSPTRCRPDRVSRARRSQGAARTPPPNSLRCPPMTRCSPRRFPRLAACWRSRECRTATGMTLRVAPFAVRDASAPAGFACTPTCPSRRAFRGRADQRGRPQPRRVGLGPDFREFRRRTPFAAFRWWPTSTGRWRRHSPSR